MLATMFDVHVPGTKAGVGDGARIDADGGAGKGATGVRRVGVGGHQKRGKGAGGQSLPLVSVPFGSFLSVRPHPTSRPT